MRKVKSLQTLVILKIWKYYTGNYHFVLHEYYTNKFHNFNEMYVTLEGHKLSKLTQKIMWINILSNRSELRERFFFFLNRKFIAIGRILWFQETGSSTKLNRKKLFCYRVRRGKQSQPESFKGKLDNKRKGLEGSYGQSVSLWSADFQNDKEACFTFYSLLGLGDKKSSGACKEKTWLKYG